MNTKFATVVCLGISAAASTAQTPQSTAPVAAVRRTCPGDPAGNLASTDCSFTLGLRVKSFVEGSVTDQAMLGAIVFSAVAQARNDPHEWGRGWDAFGMRVGSRYAQTVTKGVAQFVSGAALGVDPRHVSYLSDPLVHLPPTTGRRIGHAFMDFLTVRRSAVDGAGTRLPNIPVFAGSASSAFVGDLWYPRSARSGGQVALRAGGSLATALGASFYNEFSPDIGRLLGALVKRGGTPSTPAPATTGATKGAK